MIVAELAAKLGLDVDEQAFDRMTQVIVGLSKGLAGIGVGLGALAAGAAFLVSETTKTAGAFDKLSTRTGVGAESLQELAYAAKMSDADVETLGIGIKTLADNVDKASHGSDEAKRAFSDLGISFKDAHGKIKPADVLLREIADKFAAMPDGMKKSALATNILGKAGIELLPMLNEGSEGIARFAAEARNLGVVLDADTVKAGAAFGDELDRFNTSVRGLIYSIGGPLLPIFTKFVKALTEVSIQSRKWIASKFEKFLHVLGDAAKWVQDNFQKLKLAFVILTGFLLAQHLPLLATITLGYNAWGAAALIAGARAAAGWALATAAGWLALAPVAALIVGIILLYDELYFFATGGKSRLGDLIKWFETNDVTDTPFVRGLKALAALIFDITDPKRWQKAVDAVFYNGESLETRLLKSGAVKRLPTAPISGQPIIPDGTQYVTAAQPGAGDFFKFLAAKMGFDVKPTGPTVLGTYQSSQLMSFGGGSSPAASAQATGSTTQNMTFSPTFQFHGDVTDPDQVEKKTRATLQEFWDDKMRENYVAIPE